MAVTLSGMTLHTNNDNEGGWAGTDGADTYNNAIQGTNSESWQVSKNSTETGTLTLSSALPTTRGVFIFWMSSNLAPYYTDINLELQSTASNYKTFEVANSTNKAIGGDFVTSAIDFVNKGTSTGTFDPASFSVLRIIVDNSSSGNIRSVINNWVDAMYYGVGHTVNGTTTGDKLFEEAAAVDQNGTNEYGVLENYNGIIYSQADIDLTGTALVSDSETLVFKDTLNGYDTYNLDVTGTVTLTNTAVIAAGTIDYNFDASGATSYTQTGGSHTGYLTYVTASGQTTSGIVFQAGATATIANTLSDSTFNGCGTVTVTGTLSNCTFNSSTADAVTTADTAKVSACSFTKGAGTFNAVVLTGAANTYGWDSTLSGYDVGTAGGAGVNVAVTGGSITGSEAIHITASTGTFTISVTGGDTPSVSSAGAIVYVIAGQKTFTQTISPVPAPDYEYRLYTVTAEGSMSGAVEITSEGEEFATTGSHSYTHTETNQPIAVQIISKDYEEKIAYYTLTAADLSVTINLDVDTND